MKFGDLSNCCGAKIRAVTTLLLLGGCTAATPPVAPPPPEPAPIILLPPPAHHYHASRRVVRDHHITRALHALDDAVRAKRKTIEQKGDRDPGKNLQ